MKVYKYKHKEIFIIESTLQEDRMAVAYNKLFVELLLNREISDKKIYLSFNLLNKKITSEPYIVKALLMKNNLPTFEFLICKN